MNREGVVITTLNIEQQGQIKLFQIKIPREIKNIIGVEMGARLISGFITPGAGGAGWKLPISINRNILLGELKLQSYEVPNVFYTGELSLNKNMANADFTSAFFSPQAYTHQYNSYEDPVTVSGKTTILQGVYRDKYNGLHEASYKYSVSVYVWCEVKDDQPN